MADSTTTLPQVVCNVKICEGSGHGVILPALGQTENEWPDALRAILYLLGLAYFFMGVALVSDVFMTAIERITSQKKRVWDKDFAHSMTVKVWNASVANLTLMALGSSAPEILLSIIELLGNDFYSGDLGPSTIVGSAAFNLLVITAICVSAIPTGDERKIKDLSVFAVTASFSVFAYLWLLIIVQVWTPDIITIEEGLLTFLMFPLLVMLAYAADRGYFSNRDDVETRVCLQDASKHELAVMEMKILKKYGGEMTLSNAEIAKLMQDDFGERASKAFYRVNATRSLTGSAKKPKPAEKGPKASRVSNCGRCKETGEEKPLEATISFLSESYSILENAGHLNIVVRRGGRAATEGVIKVQFKTRSDGAKEGENFKHIEGQLVFTEYAQEQTIKVEIIDNDHIDKDAFFFVELFGLECEGIKAQMNIAAAHIKIVDDDEPGKFAFQQDTIFISESEEDVIAQVVVERQGGSKGAVSVHYRTEDDTAIGGRDYDAIDDEILKFADGQETASIDIVIKPRGRHGNETKEMFRVLLENPEGGASFVEHRDGGKEQAICEVVVESDAEQQERFARVMSELKINLDKASIGYTNWKDQFASAISVNGGDDENSEPPSILDWIMHIINLPWKLLFACIPPVDYCGGWLCFCVSLAMIGGVTAFIGDLASLFGCVVGLKDSVTAITLVALGTSLPDTFASKTAALEEETADSSIGNVTGSNSVNVFLGLGMPWTMGSVYWALNGTDLHSEWYAKYAPLEPSFDFTDYPNGGFVVIGGSLGFSVAVFTGCALCCITLIMVRRFTPSIGAELGGPNAGVKYASSLFMIGLWFVYLGASTWKAFSVTGPCD